MSLSPARRLRADSRRTSIRSKEGCGEKMMRSPWMRNGALIAGLAVSATQVSGQQQPAASAQLRNGEIGFVVSSMRAALLADGVTQAEACPEGLSLGPQEAYAKLPAERRAALEAAFAASAPARQAAAAGTGPKQVPARIGGDDVRSGVVNADGSSVCLNPGLMGPDPSFRTVDKAVRAEGMDLDGGAGRKNPDTCPHEDLVGADGVKNIDNQNARVLSCLQGYGPGGYLTDTYEGGMRSGLWTLVIKLSKVDNLLNDPEVDVLIASSEDPLQLAASGVAIRNLTYGAHADPAYHTRTTGRIINGVLSTDPVDMTYVYRSANSPGPSAITQMAARLKLSIAPDGTASGILGGYEDVERIAHVNFAVGGNIGIATRGSQLANYTCNGIYYSMLQLADGKRDPKTGKCTAISTQWKIKAAPAFVVAPPAAVVTKPPA
jgi:hypothetical protein